MPCLKLWCQTWSVRHNILRHLLDSRIEREVLWIMMKWATTPWKDILANQTFCTYERNRQVDFFEMCFIQRGRVNDHRRRINKASMQLCAPPMQHLPKGAKFNTINMRRLLGHSPDYTDLLQRDWSQMSKGGQMHIDRTVTYSEYLAKLQKPFILAALRQAFK